MRENSPNQSNSVVDPSHVRVLGHVPILHFDLIKLIRQTDSIRQTGCKWDKVRVSFIWSKMSWIFHLPSDLCVCTYKWRNTGWIVLLCCVLIGWGAVVTGTWWMMYWVTRSVKQTRRIASQTRLDSDPSELGANPHREQYSILCKGASTPSCSALWENYKPVHDQFSPVADLINGFFWGGGEFWRNVGLAPSAASTGNLDLLCNLSIAETYVRFFENYAKRFGSTPPPPLWLALLIR